MSFGRVPARKARHSCIEYHRKNEPKVLLQMVLGQEHTTNMKYITYDRVSRAYLSVASSGGFYFRAGGLKNAFRFDSVEQAEQAMAAIDAPKLSKSFWVIKKTR